MHLFAVEESSPHVRDARELLAAVSAKGGAWEDHTTPLSAMVAGAVASLRPWLSLESRSAEEALDRIASLVTEQLLATTPAFSVPGDGPVPNASASSVLFRHPDCDDLPPGGDITDDAVRVSVVCVAWLG
jgi:hypothetical protein